MNFEYWTDENGIKWKVTKMPTRLIKKQAIELDEELRELLNQPVKTISDYLYGITTINFYYDWLKRFDTELERRKGK